MLQGQVVAAQIDLRDLHSVASFAQQLRQEACIDVLILNAGVMGIPLGYTQHGFEKHIGTNYFGHFYLFQLLEDKLAAQVCAESLHRCTYLSGRLLDTCTCFHAQQ